MTDEELCKALRNFDDGATPTHEAADRIEALTEQRDAARRDAVEAEAYATELEAKLAEAIECNEEFSVDNQHLKMRAQKAEARVAKAIAALRFYSCDNSCDECHVSERDRVSCGWTARAVLAEIGSDK